MRDSRELHENKYGPFRSHFLSELLISVLKSDTRPDSISQVQQSHCFPVCRHELLSIVEFKAGTVPIKNPDSPVKKLIEKPNSPVKKLIEKQLFILLFQS
jgi:hypothetical protein